MATHPAVKLAITLAIAVLLTPSAPAQVTTATVYGIVNDPSGAVVPGMQLESIESVSQEK